MKCLKAPNRTLGTPSTKLSKSSYEEYFEGATGLCDKDIILEQFKNKNEYKEFALSSWEFTRELREDLEN